MPPTLLCCVNKKFSAGDDEWDKCLASQIETSNFPDQFKLCFLCPDRLLAEDPNSGRREYFISRHTRLDVTALTMPSVRASDPRLVSVTGTIIQGHSPGTVHIQVSKLGNIDFVILSCEWQLKLVVRH